MPTGAAKIRGGEIAQSQATELRFQNGRLIVVLTDGREISVPLKLYPTLSKATARQRNTWELIGLGIGFRWPDLDLDLSVIGLLNGIPEALPEPPSRTWKRSS